MGNMKKNAWRFIAVILLHLVWNSSSTSVALPELSELCPYNNFCTHKANKSLEDPALQSCCLPCSCNIDCGIIDKCCPDVANRSSPSHVYPCRTQEEIYDSYLNLNKWVNTDRHTYRVVDGCPTGSLENPDLSENIEHCYNASELQDLIFVTSMMSGYTYLNKHCAICNNEYAYTEWALHLLDQNLLSDIIGFEERDRHILSQGGVVSVPPEPEMAMKALCYTIASRQKCNVSGHWDIYDQEIEQKCNEQTHEYISESEFRRIGYTNVYCFICNNPKGTPVTSECKKMTFNSEDGKQRKTTSRHFSALLIAQQTVVEQDQFCSAGEVWNPFHLECTTLFCPIGAVPQGGACTSMVEFMSGYYINLALQIELDGSDDPALINFEDFADDMFRLLRRNVNIGNVKCDICSLNLNGTPKRGTIFSFSSLLTTKLCSASDLLSGLYRLFPTTSVNKLLPKTKLTTTFLTVKSETALQNVQDMIVDRSDDNCMYSTKHIIFNPTEAVYCPSIHLNQDNLHEFADHDNVISLINSNSIQIGNGTVRICMEDYISILKRTKLISGKDQLSGSKLLMLSATLLVHLLYQVEGWFDIVQVLVLRCK